MSCSGTERPEVKFCECGCGKPTSLAKETKRSKGHVKGQPLRFVNGHNRKGRGKVALTFNKALGRWVINCRDGSKYYYAKAVLENKIGRQLLPGEITHHMDDDKTNDEPGNLEVMSSQSEHATHHNLKRWHG